MKQLKNLILDMDGVLWHGETPMPGLPQFFETLNKLDINYVLATNNAARTPEQYLGKFAKFGISIQTEQVLTSAEATAGYLSQEYPAGTPTFVIGGDGLRDGLARRGFEILTVEDVLAGKLAKIVTVGFWQDVTYYDFACGAVCINQGAHFVGSNPDVTFPSEYGRLPGQALSWLWCKPPPG